MTALAARGLTNEGIAAPMVVSPFTAKTHVSRAMTKLGARDRARLVVFAYESGPVTARTQWRAGCLNSLPLDRDPQLRVRQCRVG